WLVLSGSWDACSGSSPWAPGRLGRTPCAPGSRPTCWPCGRRPRATRCTTRSPCWGWRWPLRAGRRGDGTRRGGSSRPESSSFQGASTCSPSPGCAGWGRSLRWEGWPCWRDGCSWRWPGRVPWALSTPC
ncbi:MAG: FIG00018398: hypothetical regulator, partial [uncultured Gemmatimonadetes bacterium]